MSDSWRQTRDDHRARQVDGIAAAALSLMVDHGASALTMAAVADAAGISRQTLYRYCGDVDAVLVAVARLIAAHDDQVESLVAGEADPARRLDLVARAVIGAGGHGDEQWRRLAAALPPAGREVLARHEAGIRRLLSEVLHAGVDHGSFRPDLDPDLDAPLILGLLTAADPDQPERALILVHRLVAGQVHDPQKGEPS
jgi:AcrR family transcriptional regulator